MSPKWVISKTTMADRLQKGYSDVSDNGGNETLQGFELNPKIEGVEVGGRIGVCRAGWFNCTHVMSARQSHVSLTKSGA